MKASKPRSGQPSPLGPGPASNTRRSLSSSLFPPRSLAPSPPRCFSPALSRTLVLPARMHMCPQLASVCLGVLLVAFGTLRAFRFRCPLDPLASSLLELALSLLRRCWAQSGLGLAA
eukprot:743465-Rhodomonas_salina.1